MKKILFYFAFIAISSIFSCNSNANSGVKNEAKAEISLGEFFFIFTIDGKEVTIPVIEISTTYNTALAKPVFKIMAGEYGKINLLLITSESVTSPSSTPSGSTNYDDAITQGSVSLQNYPIANYTSNSYNMNTPNSKIIIPNAITIVKSTRVGDKYRIIEGTFNTKVFGGEAGNDKNVSDHIVAGKFRLKHEFTDVKF